MLDIKIDYDEVYEKFKRKFKNASVEDFNESLFEFQSIKLFKANENIFETGQAMSEEAHYIMRIIASAKLKDLLRTIKIDTNDPNIIENENEGNIGTFGRIIKCWVGGSIDDDTELGSGRFMKPVRIASFPNTQEKNIPITKRVAIFSNCSHHFIPFSTSFDEKSYAIISYIPNKKLIGISKLQRLADYISRRFWLQEDLTKELYNQVSKAAETKDVYVKLFNIKHGCEWLRGAKNYEGGFTSEYYDGKFNNKEIRESIVQDVV